MHTAPLIIAALEQYIAGLIGISGVYDIRRLARFSFIRLFWVEPAFTSSPSVWQEASPVLHANRKLNFPVLLINGAWDFHLPKDASDLANGARFSPAHC
jgi:hypothetical protein